VIAKSGSRRSPSAEPATGKLHKGLIHELDPQAKISILGYISGIVISYLLISVYRLLTGTPAANSFIPNPNLAGTWAGSALVFSTLVFLAGRRAGPGSRDDLSAGIVNFCSYVKVTRIMNIAQFSDPWRGQARREALSYPLRRAAFVATFQ
jgi:hypothetical protein